MTCRRRRCGEEGSSLVLALVFITVIGLLIGFVLAFVETSFKYSAVARTGRGELYAADGAMEAAIARVQGGGPCGDSETTLNGVEVGITCEPAPRPQPPPVEPAPSPAQAILTLGQTPAEGLHQLAGSSDVVVRGDVYSRSVVSNASGQALQVDDEVGAIGNCDFGTIKTPPRPAELGPAVRCANKNPAPLPATAVDPGFVPDLQKVPVRRAVPPCPATDRWLVTLEPGYYDDAGALSLLTGDPARCAGKVVWFQPGAYYFNFNFSSEQRCGPADDPRCTWKISDPALNLVGGEPRGWTPENPGPMRPPIDLPGGCARDGDGVELVFGGESRVVQSAGKVELCPQSEGTPLPPPPLPLPSLPAPPPPPPPPPVAIYGLKQGVANAAPPRLSPKTATSGSGFVTPENARAVDETPVLTSDAALSSLTPAPASLTVSGFDGVPIGSRVTDVKLRIVHRETGAVGPLRATVKTDGVEVAGSPFDIAACSKPDATFCDDRTIDLDPLAPEQISKLSVTYEASPAAEVVTDPLLPGTPRTGTESLDGIVLQVEHTPPALEGLGGCLDEPYDPAAATPKGCALLKTTGAASSLAIGGTVYAPSAAVDLDLAGVSAPVLNRGIITAALRLKIVTSGYTGPVVSEPEVRPTRAVLALRRDPGAGVVQTAEAAPGVPSRALVRGDVFSHSGITNEASDPLLVQGRVTAVGGCTGPITGQLPPPAEPEVDCDQGAAARTEGADPAYVSAIDIVPPRRSAPERCDTPVVAVEPGYYDDAKALSRLTSSQCAGKVVWLKPGVYYFNFNFMAGSPPGSTCPDELCTWTIDSSVDVVGGTTPGWDERAATRPRVEIPGGCRTDKDGVQLIFGGQSRLHHKTGNMELCPYRKSKLSPPIPIYGLSRGTAGERNQSFPATTHTSANFSNPTNAYEIDEQPKRLTADAPETTSLLATVASITVGGFQPDVPEGSRLARAAVRVAHKETGTGGLQTVTVVSGQGEILATQTVASCSDFSGAEGCPTRIPLPDITPTQLQGIRVTYNVTVAGLTGPKEELDGIELEVDYTPPSFEAVGCLTAIPTTSGAAVTCDLVKADEASKLVLNGTVYAPTAALDLARNGLSTPIVNDGVVADTLRLRVKPAACYTGPAISHLDAQFPSEPVEPGVVFTACIGKVPVLRSRVVFKEGAAAKVESWSVLR